MAEEKHREFRRIAPGLRLPGAAMALFFPTLRESQMPRLAALCRFAFRGRWPGRRTDCRTVALTRADGTRLRLLVVTPKTPRPGAPGLVWMHGGGYAFGVPEQDCAYIERFVLAGGCTVVSPDYRLSWQAPYPAALEDCYAALVWLRSRARELGVRDDQLFVGGDSAGGGLAAALCLYARKKNEVAVAYQMPFYPMLDDRMASGSARDNRMPVWDSAKNAESWRAYLGPLFGTGRVPAFAAPARAESLAGLPPLCTFVGTEEPFHDETAAYVQALRAAGVPADFLEFPGCYHAFDTTAPASAQARLARAFYMDSFRRAVRSCFAPQPEK